MIDNYNKGEIYYYPVLIKGMTILLLTTVESVYDKAEVSGTEPNVFYNKDKEIIWPYKEKLDDKVVRKTTVNDFYPNLGLAIRKCVELIFEKLK